ncbi:MAG: ferrous iron transport protein B, partial [Proteobacteria bacterium]|nr:ferrous iron transport protein B [Pseudomonadota bacterium]
MLHDMKHSKVGLVGNPNCGKTTLFNVLSRSQQRVGNWPGVTVERQSGFYTHGKESVEVIDLPGIYSLIAMTKTESIDAEIACDTILSNQVDVIVNVIDAAHLERHLYLTTQLLEMSVPVVIALNMIDVVKQNGLKIDIQKLEQMLGCPVVCIQANKNIGMEELKDTIAQVIKNKTTQKAKKILTLPPVVEESIKNIIPYLDNFPVSQQRCVALRLLEGDQTIHAKVGTEINDLLKSLQQKIENEFKEEADIILADARYSFAHEVSQRTVQESGKKSVNWTERLDRIILNRVLGLPIFLGVMYCMFLFAIHIGGAFQDFFDISTQTIFVEGLAHGFTTLQFPPWFTAIVVAGVGKGINTTLTFVPVIAAMFFFLSFLEDSGYMARAAFVMDRVMRALRLPGKSFVPLIIGFGCNVPAVMAARTLENKQDRILTVLMTPFMSCGARLAIYAVFTTAFFPVGGQNIVFALYMIGILVAVFTAWLLRKTWLGGESTPLVLELPRYHVPRFSVMCMHTWSRLKKFIYKAGKYIIPICVIIGGLNAITVDGGLNLGE